MRAGKLDRQISIERLTETIAASGAVSQTWAPIATVRAELVQQTTEELLAGPGEAETASVVFRIRYLAGLTTADRITSAGQTFDLEAILEMGRRRGLELKARGVMK